MMAVLQPRAMLNSRWCNGAYHITPHFLTPQINYLLGVLAQSQPVALHLLCLERFTHDLQEFGQRYENFRYKGIRDTTQSDRTRLTLMANRSAILHMSGHVADWVNHVAFPADHALHTLVCERNATRGGGMSIHAVRALVDELFARGKGTDAE